MFQFFVSPGQITPEGVVITGSDVNHIKNALRMKSGEQVRVSDQQGGNFLCEVAAISQEQVALKIIRPCAGTELPVKATLFQGLPKGDKMEMIIQKGVELGACEIVPVAMQNCVVKLDGRKAAARQARWQAIAESAAKQSKRSLIPQVLPVRSFAEAVEYAKTLDLCLMPYEQARGMAYTREVFGKIEKGSSVGIFIGPEGGFSPKEIQAVEGRMELVTLGNRILRTETAGVAALAMLAYEMEA
ncbi:MAG: 16S rRNA (uracil(1498)-N(3))-methyltransferase [Lachnospiraceae bacterium]|jgi:16S rRNA (uracil1498-N3)-methyltransferase|nr:16S rRNA (uracil(1498)-N(3))-methyltransferase [Lachnospiraceae bacterium]